MTLHESLHNVHNVLRTFVCASSRLHHIAIVVAIVVKTNELEVRAEDYVLLKQKGASLLVVGGRMSTRIYCAGSLN